LKLSRNSWHVGLNDYIYGEGYSEDNNNLCPYFWGTILAVIGCIPVAIVRGIGGVMSDGLKVFLLRYGVAMFWIGLGIALGSVWWVVFGILYFLFNIVLYKTEIFDNFVKWLSGKKKPKPPKPHRERKPHMTVEMFKGWKNKHCPMVVWE